MVVTDQVRKIISDSISESRVAYEKSHLTMVIFSRSRDERTPDESLEWRLSYQALPSGALVHAAVCEDGRTILSPGCAWARLNWQEVAEAAVRQLRLEGGYLQAGQFDEIRAEGPSLDDLLEAVRPRV